MSVQVAPTQRCHWYSNSIVCVPVQPPLERTCSVWPCTGVVSSIVGNWPAIGTGGVNVSAYPPSDCVPASIVPGVVVKLVSAQKIVLLPRPVLVTLRQLTAPGIGPLPV